MEYSASEIIFVLSIVLSFSSTLAQQQIPDACNEHPEDYWYCNGNQGCLCIINRKQTTIHHSQDLNHKGSYVFANVDNKLAIDLYAKINQPGQKIITYPQAKNNPAQEWAANEELSVPSLTGATKYFRLHSAVAPRNGSYFLAVEETSDSELKLGKFKGLHRQLWTIQLLDESVPPKVYIQNYKTGHVMCSEGNIQIIKLRGTPSDPKCEWRISEVRK